MALKRTVSELERQVEQLESSNSSLGKQVSAAAQLLCLQARLYGVCGCAVQCRSVIYPCSTALHCFTDAALTHHAVAADWHHRHPCNVLTAAKVNDLKADYARQLSAAEARVADIEAARTAAEQQAQALQQQLESNKAVAEQVRMTHWARYHS
jgi:cell division septum initiation protein DivIVA